MFAFVRRAASHAAGHALPLTAASLLVAAAAGGGITFALAGHAASAAASASAPRASAGAGPAKAKAKAKAGDGAVLTSALTLLAADSGQSVTAIRSQLATGRSLADIAGPAASKFESDLAGRLRTALDRKVAAGRITAAQESAHLAKATATLHTLMTEPGTTLMQHPQRLREFVHSRAAGHGAGTATASATATSPAATP